MKKSALTLLLIAGSAFAGDRQFDHIVKAIETHYGTERLHVPFMGMANFLVKVARPEGASSLKLAVFENLNSSADDWRERDRFMETIATGSLRPMVRAYTRKGEEATYILAGPEGKSTRMLIATFERNEAVVIEVKVNVNTLLKAIDDPEHARITFGAATRDEP